ncbi:hypothetical protein D6C82_10321, partial [Aureobasidium pullulans]
MMSSSTSQATAPQPTWKTRPQRNCSKSSNNSLPLSHASAREKTKKAGNTKP